MIYSNRPWKVVYDNYLRRVKRMCLNQTVIMIYEPTWSIEMLNTISKSAKEYNIGFCAITHLSDELIYGKKIYFKNKSKSWADQLIPECNNKIVEFINENHRNNDYMD